MADTAHNLTDQLLADMEKRLAEIYRKAEKDLARKVEAYFRRFEAADKAKQALVMAGKMTQEEYTRWRQGQLMMGEHWREMQRTIAQDMARVNEIAVAYVNGRLPEVYALNYNVLADDLANRGISFELVDASTVRNLAVSDETLLPYKKVDNQKVVRWNTQQVNSQVTQGILQGESIPDLAKRLSEHIPEMNYSSAVRNARTTVTSAENKGRIDSYHDAQDMGIVLKKVWIATHDARVRPEHAELDGVEVEVDEPFYNGLGEIRYPGDPLADPGNVYNCRCTIVSHVIGFGEQEVFSEKYEAYMPNNIDFLPNRTVEDVRYAVANMQGAEGDAWKEIIDNAKIVGGDSNFFDPQNMTVTLNKDETDARAVFHELAHSIDVGSVNVSLDEWTDLNSVSELLDELTHRAVFDGASNDFDTLCQYIGLDLQSNDAGKEFLDWIKEIKQNYGDSNAAILSDLVDGFTSGDLEVFTMLYGFHGKNYWMTPYGGGSGSLLSQEAWAHYCSLRATGQNEMLDLLDKMVPNLSEALKFAYHEVFKV